MAPALEVADIFRRYGEAFRQAHAGHLGGVERRIMGAIMACRTAVLGGHVEQCDDCGVTRIAWPLVVRAQQAAMPVLKSHPPTQSRTQYPADTLSR